MKGFIMTIVFKFCIVGVNNLEIRMVFKVTDVNTHFEDVFIYSVYHIIALGENSNVLFGIPKWSANY